MIFNSMYKIDSQILYFTISLLRWQLRCCHISYVYNPWVAHVFYRLTQGPFSFVQINEVKFRNDFLFAEKINPV